MGRASNCIIADAAALYQKIRVSVGEGCPAEGLALGQELISLLCGVSSITDTCSDWYMLNAPSAPQRHDASQRAVLTTAAVVNLLHCASECQQGDALTATVLSLEQPLQVLPLWVRLLAPAEATKWASVVTRALIKCAQLPSASGSDDVTTLAKLPLQWSLELGGPSEATSVLSEVMANLPDGTAVEVGAAFLDDLSSAGSFPPDDQFLRLVEKLCNKACGKQSSARVAAAAIATSCQRVPLAGIFVAALRCRSDPTGVTWISHLTGAASAARLLTPRAARGCRPTTGGAGKSRQPSQRPQQRQLAQAGTVLRGIGMLRKEVLSREAVALDCRVAEVVATALECAACPFAVTVAADEAAGCSNAGSEWSSIVRTALHAAAAIRVKYKLPGPICCEVDFGLLLPGFLPASRTAGMPLSCDEARWLAAEMGNLGVTMQARGQPSRAAAPLAVACGAAAAAATLSAKAGASTAETTAAVRYAAMKLSTWIACLTEAGRSDEVAAAAATTVAAVVSSIPAALLLPPPSMLPPLVSVWVDARSAMGNGSSSEFDCKFPYGLQTALQAMGVLPAVRSAMAHVEALTWAPITAASGDDAFAHRSMCLALDVLDDLAPALDAPKAAALSAAVLRAKAVGQSCCAVPGEAAAAIAAADASLAAMRDHHRGSEDTATSAALAAALAWQALRLASNGQGLADEACMEAVTSCIDTAADAWAGSEGTICSPSGLGGSDVSSHASINVLEAESACQLSSSWLASAAHDLQELHNMLSIQGRPEAPKLHASLQRLHIQLHHGQLSSPSDRQSDSFDDPPDDANPKVPDDRPAKTLHYRSLCTVCGIISGTLPAGSSVRQADSNEKRSLLQRVRHHCNVAMECFRSGDVVTALSDSRQAVRLTARLAASPAGSGAHGAMACDIPRPDATYSAPGFWELQGMQIGVLLQHGTLLEALSSPEEAIWALQEALGLAEGCAATPLVLLCHAQLAEVHARRGDEAAAKLHLEDCEGAEQYDWCGAGVVLARVHLAGSCLARASSGWEAALKHCQEGTAAARAASTCCCPGVSAADASCQPCWLAEELELRLQLHEAKCLYGQGADWQSTLQSVCMEGIRKQHPVQAACTDLFVAATHLADCQPGSDCPAWVWGTPGVPNTSKEGTLDLEQLLGQLLVARRTCQHVPILRKKASSLAAQACSATGRVHAALAFLHDSLGVAVHSEYRRVISHRAARAARGASGSGRALCDEELSACEATAAALSILDSALASDIAELEESSRVALEAAAAQLARPGVALCSISSIEPLHQAGATCLVISRYVAGSVPLVVQLRLGDDDSPGLQDALDELTCILQGSDASLAPGPPLQTPALRAGWWDTRYHLDQQLAKLLMSLDDQCLGPWRCLLVGLHLEKDVTSELADAASDATIALSKLPRGHSTSTGGKTRQSRASHATKQKPVGDEDSPLHKAIVAGLCEVAAGAATTATAGDTNAIVSAAAAIMCCDATASANISEMLWKRCQAIKEQAVTAAAQDAANAKAASTLGRGCSTSYRQAMTAAEAAFMTADPEVARATTRSSRQPPSALLSDPETPPPQPTARRGRATKTKAALADISNTDGNDANTELLNSVQQPKTPAPIKILNNISQTSASIACTPAAAPRANTAVTATAATPAASFTRSRLGGMRGTAATPATVRRRREPRPADAYSRATPRAALPTATTTKATPRPSRFEGMTAQTAVKSRRPPLSERFEDAAEADTDNCPASPPAQSAAPATAIPSSTARIAGSLAPISAGHAVERNSNFPADAHVASRKLMTTALALPPPVQRRHREAAREDAPGRAATLLVTGPSVQALPWESLPSLRRLRIYRVPSLACAVAVARRQQAQHAQQTQHAQHAEPDGTNPAQLVTGADTAGIADLEEGLSDLSLAANASQSSRESLAVKGGLEWSGVGNHGTGEVRRLSASDAYYLLNPGGDLPRTQSKFQERFAAQEGWRGEAGSAPSPSDVAAAVQAASLFVYLGHGGGEQYIPRKMLASLRQCGAALLMGCSSGRLRLHRQYDPTGSALAYLLAGSPTAVANLWDVTDVDIDRFASAILDSWLGTAQEDPVSMPAGNREDDAIESKRRRSCPANTSSVEEARHSMAASADATGSVRVVRAENGGHIGFAGGGNSGGRVCDKRHCIAATVAEAREICRLPHLIGAAPVCYGVPTEMWMCPPINK